ncbi:MAG TPA: phytanoyl-CoA dioxygenase family protein [Pseudomonadales bacterium]
MTDRYAEARPGYRVSDDALALCAEIRRLGLESHIAELETLGYTVVPPEKAAPEGFAERLKEAVLEVVVRRGRIRPDLLEGLEYRDPPVPFGEHFAFLLFENPVFQEAVCNPVVDCLVTYLLGRSAVLSNCLAFLKGPGEADLALHCDHVYVPAPFPPQAQVCNATWALTGYDRDNGAVCFVPGSHTLGRHPEPGEGLDQRVAVEAPAGSLLFWHGATWHGAFARRRPGVRINLINAFMRMHMRPQEPYREHVTPEILAANPPVLATRLGQHVHYGWQQEGPDYGKLGTAPAAQRRWD